MVLIPPPYLDEVWGSVIIRAARRTGLPIARINRILRENGIPNSGFVLTSALGRLANLCGEPPDHILRRHTLFPYIVAFMSPEIRARLAEKSIYPLRREESLTSLAKSVTQAVPFLRLCPKCVEEDMCRHGESFWHRAHLLPAVYMCLKHGVRLRDTPCPLKFGTRRSAPLLPQDVQSTAHRLRVGADILRAIAELSLHLLDEHIIPSGNRFQEYRKATLEKGYRTSVEMIATAPLSADLRQFFGAGFLSGLECPIQVSEKSPWPALMVRSEAPGLTFSPVKHVLFRTFLKMAMPPSDFLYQKPGKKPFDHRREDVETVRKIRVILQAHEGVPVRFKVKDLLIQTGAWTSFRHRREEFPLTNAFLQAFRASDQSERQIGRRPYWRKKLKLDD